MWAYTPKSPKLVFWYKFVPKGYIPLSDFFYKIWHGGGVLDLHSRAKFHRCGFKMWSLKRGPQIAKNGGINLPLRENPGAS